MNTTLRTLLPKIFERLNKSSSRITNNGELEHNTMKKILLKVSERLNKSINSLSTPVKKAIFLLTGILIGYICFELIFTSASQGTFRIPDPITRPDTIYPDSSSQFIDSLHFDTQNSTLKTQH